MTVTTRDIDVMAERGPRGLAQSRTNHPRPASASSPVRVMQRRSRPAKILFISANPRDSDSLAIQEEYRAIEQRIRMARHRDAFQLIFRPAARRGDLQDALLEHTPDVVHFACHGSPQAEIHLLADGPGSDPVPAESLVALFEALHTPPLLVVLNACFASVQAQAICSAAIAAIGMRSRIRDHAAIDFASALYGALAHDRSVAEAFQLGVAALDASDRDIPALFITTGAESRRLIQVEPGPASRVASRTTLALLATAGVLGLAGWLGRSPAREPGPALAPGAPFVLEARLEAQRSVRGTVLTVPDLQHGDIVMSGDRLQVSVRTSRNAYLYVAFCSQPTSDPRYRILRQFPEYGGIPVTANRVTRAPEQAALIVDNHPGEETLYVIVSRDELSFTDAALAEVLAIARRQGDAAECGESFHDAVKGPHGPEAAAQLPGADRHHPGQALAGKAVDGPAPGQADARRSAATIERGVDVVWGGAQTGYQTDPSGIVVLSFDLVHKAR